MGKVLKKDIILKTVMAYYPSKVAWSGLTNNMFILSKFIPNFGEHSSQQD